jgi:serine protease Do
MAAVLLGALVTTQIRPQAARASVEPAVAGGSIAPSRSGAFGLETFRDIARSRTPGVVNINTKKELKRSGRDPFHDFFGQDMMDRFFGPQGGEKETQRSLGSGFIIDKDGYILTNRHVVEGADEISVTLSTQRPGDRPFAAKLVGKDARTDVALLKIEPKGALTLLPLGNSYETEVGEWVMAIGNPFGLGGNSVTVGVVSYKGRNMQLGVRMTGVDMIQTDAAINPGNSGGPLANARGEVIGVNTFIFTKSGGSEGIGFAIPIDATKRVVDEIIRFGKVRNVWIGVRTWEITPYVAERLGTADRNGLYVAVIERGSPADKSGIKVGDIIRKVNGTPVRDSNEAYRVIFGSNVGDTVSLTVERDGKLLTMKLPLEETPEE